MTSKEDIQKLRQETGAGMMECKKSLEEARGDFSRARKHLAKNAVLISQKKAERIANQGIIEAYVHQGKIGVLLELATETDFVSRNADFKGLAHELVMQIASMNPQNIEDLLKGNYIRDETLTVKNLLDAATAKLGENIQIKRFIRFELGEEV
ncbi:MAG TPA: translation elongation factor Ts [Patescibacteria group bacterium]|nr:translation elongation factor Ts [Patescibacteria group bacterium]